MWLEPGQIRYFKREGRINYAFTTRKKLRTPLPLSRIARQLEEYGFVQINRSVVIHLDQLDNYSFWENDKYIVRLKGGVDFVASRNRVKQLKVKLKKEVLL